MKPSQVNPTIAENLGWNVDELNDKNKVTIVRRRVVYEELVVTKNEFDEMNRMIVGNEDFYWNDLKMNDIQFPDFGAQEMDYIAFPGNVTSFTEDALSFMFDNKHWTDPYEPIKMSS